MAFLSIAAKVYPVKIDGATEDPPYEVGARSRAFAGNLRRTVRAVKRQWTFTLGPIYDHEYAMLRADVATAASVTVTGTAMGGANVTAAVILGAAPYVEDVFSHRRMVQVTVLEV